MEERPDGDSGSEYPNGPVRAASMTRGYGWPTGDGKAGGPRWLPGIVQRVEPDGVLDLLPGYLDANLLPVDMLRTAYADAFAEYGPAALTYGENRGPLPLRSALAARTARADAVPCGPEHLLVTAGTSQMLDLFARWLGQPGDVVLTESVTYNFGRSIFADRGLRVRGVQMDGSGLDPAALDRAAAAERAAGRRVAFVYMVPTFHNPTGLSVPRERRLELLAVTRRHRLVVVEDDAYAGLEFEPDAEWCSLAGLAGYRGVIRLCTFSKSLAPGLRLGWMLTDPRRVERIAMSATVTSGGGLNHLAALAIGGLMETGAYDEHVTWLRSQLRARRDALVGALRAGLPEDFRVRSPGGGFFVWIRLPSGCSEAQLVASAEQAGVPVAPGSRFGRAGEPALRLSFSFHSPSQLTEAAQRLVAAWRGTPSR
ncbi:MAG: aminotransferase class I/II-fold pyridoxal phosphate-dependent enzyme [Egibacteraceae bacterium]